MDKRFVIIKIFKIVACTLLILGLLYVLFYCTVVPFLAIVFEGNMIKNGLDNSYIDSDFDGWNDVNISDTFDFKIPGDWAIDYSVTNNIQLRDENGRLIAYGTMISGENDIQYPTESEAFQQITGLDYSDFEYVHIPEFLYIYGSIMGILKSNVEENLDYYFVILEEYDYGIFFIISEDFKKDVDALIPVFQAIAYSVVDW